MTFRDTYPGIKKYHIPIKTTFTTKTAPEDYPNHNRSSAEDLKFETRVKHVEDTLKT